MEFIFVMMLCAIIIGFGLSLTGFSNYRAFNEIKDLYYTIFFFVLAIALAISMFIIQWGDLFPPCSA